jgi:predicted metal-dependent phosphoesterase TrpH
MSVDLHTHSSRSDGSDAPAVLIEKAAAAGLTTVALTDHDNLDGIAEARLAAAKHGIGFIPGTELSVEWDTGAMHMLVYFLEPEPGPLQDRLAWLQESRANRNQRIASRLQDLGIDITYEEVLKQAEGSGVGRPHFAALLIEKGHVATFNEAFDVYLAQGRKAYEPRARLGALEAITLARASRAVPVIAHPHTLGVSERDYSTAFSSLAAEGLGGIEAHYSEYPQDLRDHLAAVCSHLGIVATGGSDYHGTYKPEVSIGVGRGDLDVPDKVVEELVAAR